MQKILTIVGLSLNFIGAFMLWKFTPPNPVEMRNNIVAVISTETVAKAAKNGPIYLKLTRIGWILLGVGFLVQIIGSTFTK